MLISGDRTVLAVTMLDLVNDEDQMEKTINLLTGKTRPYKEGIVGVINRRSDVNSRRVSYICLVQVRTCIGFGQPLRELHKGKLFAH